MLIKNIRGLTMYDILNFPNGQPVILYKENAKVAMYVIDNGRVFSRGIVFNNVCKDYRVFASSNSVFYISTNCEIIFATLTVKGFVSNICMSLNSCNDSSYIKNVFPIEFLNNIFIFYVILNNETQMFSVYYIDVRCPAKSILAKNNISILSNIEIYTTSKNIIINLQENNKNILYAFDTSMKFKCIYSNEEIINQNNELAQQVGKLQDELRKTKYNYL